MKRLNLLAWALLMPALAIASPTVTNITKQEYEAKAKAMRSNGADAPEPLTFELSTEKRTFFTGLDKSKKEGLRQAEEVDFTFLKADGKVPGRFDISSDFGVVLTGIFNQGNCGSCVYNSAVKNFADFALLHGQLFPTLSRQYVMDYMQRQWMCSGSFFEYVAKGICAGDGIPSEADYPYKARDQQGQGKPAKRYNIPGVTYSLIDTSPKSITAALHQRTPVSVTVAADGLWSGYSTGVYNGCSSMSTNHQVLIYGWDCETSVDAEGMCVFNAQGYPINGDGYAIVPNSWGTSWGTGGVMKSRWLGRSGQKCNNLAEEAGIFKADFAVPVDGGWTPWTDWSPCDAGQQTRTRTCTNPTPKDGGKACVGEPKEVRACVVPPTPTPGALPVWAWILIGALGSALVILGVLFFTRK